MASWMVKSWVMLVSIVGISLLVMIRMSMMVLRIHYCRCGWLSHSADITGAFGSTSSTSSRSTVVRRCGSSGGWPPTFRSLLRSRCCPTTFGHLPSNSSTRTAVAWPTSSAPPIIRLVTGCAILVTNSFISLCSGIGTTWILSRPSRSLGVLSLFNLIIIIGDRIDIECLRSLMLLIFTLLLLLL